MTALITIGSVVLGVGLYVFLWATMMRWQEMYGDEYDRIPVAIFGAIALPPFFAFWMIVRLLNIRPDVEARDRSLLWRYMNPARTKESVQQKERSDALTEYEELGTLIRDGEFDAATVRILEDARRNARERANRW